MNFKGFLYFKGKLVVVLLLCSLPLLVTRFVAAAPPPAALLAMRCGKTQLARYFRRRRLLGGYASPLSPWSPWPSLAAEVVMVVSFSEPN